MDATTGIATKKKALLVPLVALMMCVVAVIGIGYAAVQTSSEYSTNSVDADLITLSLSKTDGGAEVSGNVLFDPAALVDAYTVKSGGSITGYQAVICTSTLTAYVKIVSDHAYTSCKLTGTITPANAAVNNIVSFTCDKNNTTVALALDNNNESATYGKYVYSGSVTITVAFAGGVSVTDGVATIGTSGDIYNGLAALLGGTTFSFSAVAGTFA